MPGRRPVQLFLVAVLGLVAFGTSEALARDSTTVAQDTDVDLLASGAQVYAENCAVCHQPGGAGIPGSFPPLAGNPNAVDADRVASVVSGGLSETIEVFGVTYATEMAALDLSDDDLAAVAAYVASLASADPGATPTTTAAVVGPGDIRVGKNLFRGATTLENGGAACAGCHTAGSVGNLGGSGLGPDLTHAIETFGGEVGLTAWLGSPPSATMTPLFGDRPLTDSEIADLVAFLAEAPDQSQPSYFGDALIWFGLGGLLVLVLGMGIAWRGMRQTYVQKLSAGSAPRRRGETQTDEKPRRIAKLRGARP